MTMAKGMGPIFSLFNVKRCLLAYCSTYNAVFMDLSVSGVYPRFFSK